VAAAHGRSHNVRNALAAAACALAAGAPLAPCAGPGRPSSPWGRSQLRSLQLAGRAAALVDDSYNANPDSVRAAIDVLAGLPGPRWLVLGDMGEVGDQGPAFHAEVGAYARARGIEHVWTRRRAVRPRGAAYAQARAISRRTGAAAGRRCRRPRPAASVLVKGSRSCDGARGASPDRRTAHAA
jgi:UDP-N-acetylmuramoyl-tripeptide--D-alanyl-D-alanine ligase